VEPHIYTFLGIDEIWFKEEEDLSSGMLCHVVSYKLTDVSEVITASIIRDS
jgi:hypothetical protein